MIFVESKIIFSCAPAVSSPSYWQINPKSCNSSARHLSQPVIFPLQQHDIQYYTTMCKQKKWNSLFAKVNKNFKAKRKHFKEIALIKWYRYELLDFYKAAINESISDFYELSFWLSYGSLIVLYFLWSFTDPSITSMLLKIANALSKTDLTPTKNEIFHQFEID